MQITREDLNPCTVRLTVTCTPEQVDDAFAKALKQIAKQVKLPGFRPGHAPASLVEKSISEQELSETAADTLVRTTYKVAIEQEKLEPDHSTRVAVDIQKFDRAERQAEYIVKIPLPPKIELADYKGVEAERPRVAVSEEEIDYQLDELRKRRSTREQVTDRGVQEGDVAVINVRIDGDATEGRNFMTIAGQTFPALDEALMGMKVEEMKALDLTFPANFQEKDWANTTHHCQVTLNSVSTVKLPELDDSFAQLYKTESVDELRGRVAESITNAKLQMSQELLTEQVLEKLQAASTIHVSDNMWEGLASQRLQETAQEQRKAGKTLEQYAQENGMTLDQLIEAWKEKAKLHVERALIIREVFSAEKMQLTNVELTTELYQMSQEYEMEPQALLETLKKNEALDELHFRAISRKVSDFLIENAKVTEVDLS